jgi:hypothetical protein
MIMANVRGPYLAIATLVGVVAVAGAPAFAANNSIDSPEAAQGVSLDRFGHPVVTGNTEQQMQGQSLDRFANPSPSTPEQQEVQGLSLDRFAHPVMPSNTEQQQ